jgi:SAM-dependent methyltransferase
MSGSKLPLPHKRPNWSMTLFNDLYNWVWISRRRLQANPKLEDLLVHSAHLGSDSNGGGVSWLRNLERLVRRVSEEESLSRLNFIDVGTGTGITAIYAASRFGFKDVEGFDFESNLIDIANANLNKKTIPAVNCRFYVANAAEINFEKYGPSVFYIANSFGNETMTSFINNNLQFILKNDCYIAICNDHLANLLLDTHELRMIWRNAKYNCSLFSVQK